MKQIMGIVDSYAYRSIIGGVFWQLVVVPMTGGQPDEAAVQAAMPRVELCLDEFARLKGDHPFLTGLEPSLADLLLAPVTAYLLLTPEGKEAMAARPTLGRWFEVMNARESMRRTQPRLG
jgi:glutathione S-transferase